MARMTTPAEDPNLPQRLRAQTFIREGEARVGRGWFRVLTRFLDRVRPAVLGGAGAIDPGRVSDSQSFWTDQVDVEVMPIVDSVLRSAGRRVLPGFESRDDTWVSAYLNAVGNRLSHVPDEVYGLIVAEIERGLRNQDGIPEITAAVQSVLTASATPYWPNRARTVARTETIAAVNAGVFRAAELDAQQRGDVAPFKQWLSTEDSRTRPTHVDADMQRTLLREPFIVGGARLLFPGDPRGPAQEVINCRCTMLPVVLGETIDWTDRQNARGTT